MYVSIDDDVNKWKSFLNKHKDLAGIHINQIDQDRVDSIWKLYNMRGIPHYILIDQKGKIKWNNSPRPSSPKLISEIEKMLLTDN